ncbi:MAG: tetrahydrodipicolinate N-succinyltransferase N-terminal domain-containing protein [Candidatus Saccharimonadales bacterium]
MPSIPATKAEFNALVENIQSLDGYESPNAFAFGLATVEGEGEDRQVLDVQYTRRNYLESFGTAAILAQVLGQSETGGLQTGHYELTRANVSRALNLFTPFLGESNHPNITTLRRIANGVQNGVSASEEGRGFSNRRIPILGVVRSWEDTPSCVGDLYLRLYALSDRRRLPNTVNIEAGRDFSLLPNVVITEALGTFSVDRWNDIVERIAFRGLSTAVRVLDKFPRMLDHVVPSGVRIADPSRVRLGAHLGIGTTVMHEGFANFNAGTIGASMVEGRISAGVLVGEGSDIGGGASIMGTMSGGGKEVITIGEKCLLEANSGTGISLGDNCRVEAGTYIKSTTPVQLPDGDTVKAALLSGSSNMMLRRNATTGVVELLPTEGTEWGGLNQVLHSNQ